MATFNVGAITLPQSGAPVVRYYGANATSVYPETAINFRRCDAVLIDGNDVCIGGFDLQYFERISAAISSRPSCASFLSPKARAWM